LVTGGAGFIGANLVRTLVKQGYEVTVLDNLSVGRRESLGGLPLQFIEGDILDAATIRDAVKGQGGIVHLAAQTGVPGSLENPRRDCEVNVIGTLNLLEACRDEMAKMQKPDGAMDPAASRQRGPRVVFASSNAPLGRQTPPATEDKAPLPVSPYGASKLAGEGYCLAYHGSWGLPTVALRFGNVYGPFSSHKGSVVAKFIKDILAGKNLQVDGDGEQTRDFIYVGDLCRAVLLALESTVSGEVFQIATGVETRIQEIAHLVQQVCGKPIEVCHGPGRQGDIRRNFSVIDKARRILGWEPKINLVQGLRETEGWFRNEADAPIGTQTPLIHVCP
jgi:UDP-glucose 4-epimerase